MSCQVLRCGRDGAPSAVPGRTSSWALCPGHREAIAGGAPFSVEKVGAAGGRDMYYAKVGEWQAVLSREGDRLAVHTELNELKD